MNKKEQIQNSPPEDMTLEELQRRLLEAELESEELRQLNSKAAIEMNEKLTAMMEQFSNSNKLSNSAGFQPPPLPSVEKLTERFNAQKLDTLRVWAHQVLREQFGGFLRLQFDARDGSWQHEANCQQALTNAQHYANTAVLLDLWLDEKFPTSSSRSIAELEIKEAEEQRSGFMPMRPPVRTM